uniref:NAD kinase n=1 Tax=Aquiluna sp. TaxID=2053504 RepID=UPI004047C06D
MSRFVLVVSNATDGANALAALDVCHELEMRGFHWLLDEEDHGRLGALSNQALDSSQLFADQEIEVVLVLGGDGSILRAAELVREQVAPILGINLGHVGFMAEAEREDLQTVLDRLERKDYEVGFRVALEVEVFQEGELVFSSWAVNEVTVEKSARERVLEVVLEVDGRPVSSFGCDGVLVSTPTGSTAYAFSAGGPVVWPNVEALLVVPLSAHALFSRPLVIGPKSLIAIEVLKRSPGAGVMWCDGRRTFDLGPGARIEVNQSARPVPMIMFDENPFTDRLVRKFSLPVTGWRGPEEQG